VHPLTKNGLLEVEDLSVWAEAGPGGGCGGLEPQGRRQPSPHQQEQRAASRQLSAHQQDLRLHHQHISKQLNTEMEFLNSIFLVEVSEHKRESFCLVFYPRFSFLQNAIYEWT
jgi:hypothetical protein